MGLVLAFVAAAALAAALARATDAGTFLAQGPQAWEAALVWGSSCRWQPGGERQRRDDACGPAALAAVLRARGQALPQELLWNLCRQRGGGTTLARLGAVAGRFGHTTRLRRVGDLSEVAPPAIVHLRRRHFVVLWSLDGTRARILDPAHGSLTLATAALERQASGAVLEFAASLAQQVRP